MACAKYSPQVHKLIAWSAWSEWDHLVRQKSTAFVGKSHSLEGGQQKFTSCEGNGDKLLWKSHEKDSLSSTEDGGERRHC